MKGMRALSVLMIVMLVSSIFIVGLKSCGDDKGLDNDAAEIVCELEDSDETEVDEVENDTDTTEEFQFNYEPVKIPLFVKRLLADAEWRAETLCVANGKAYYWGCDNFYRLFVIFDKDRVHAVGPTLGVTTVEDSKEKFCISVVGKRQLIDFSDDASVRKLSLLFHKQPQFTHFRKDSLAEFGNTLFCSIAVDFPKKSVWHSDCISEWLVEKIMDAQFTEENVPTLNAIYIGYKKGTKRNSRYKGDVHDVNKVLKSAIGYYFMITKADWGPDDVDFPFCLFSTQNFQARVLNKRFVSYQRYVHDYYGGAHGFYTERLLSFDHVHRQEIDYNYLFNPGTEKEVLAILQDEAQKTPEYKQWHPEIEDFVVGVDSVGKPTGIYTFPQPGLSEDGVVFSFQPYAISCFAAGTFHFTIPYERIKHLMTPRGKWCVGI